MTAPALLVAPCSWEASKHAVMNWHYSTAMPISRHASYGVWEYGRFVGAVMFGYGTGPYIGDRYGLAMGEIVELTRVALTDHVAPVSEIVARALRQFKDNNPGTRLVVSYADTEQGHHGGIYQAGNWIYTGATGHRSLYLINGQIMHSRTVDEMRVGIEYIRRNIDPEARRIPVPGKHRYLMPLDKQMRRQVLKLAQPYPVRAGEASEVTRRPSGPERQVRPLPPALPAEGCR